MEGIYMYIMYIWVCVCMHACMHVYVCMYVYIYGSIYVHLCVCDINGSICDFN